MKRNFITMGVYALIIVVMFFGISIRGVADISLIENRELAQFPALRGETYLSGSFQSEMEAALSDQLLFSDRLKASYMSFQAVSLDVWVDAFHPQPPVEQALNGATEVSQAVVDPQDALALTDSGGTGTQGDEAGSNTPSPELLEPSASQEGLLPEDPAVTPEAADEDALPLQEPTAPEISSAEPVSGQEAAWQPIPYPLAIADGGEKAYRTTEISAGLIPRVGSMMELVASNHLIYKHWTNKTVETTYSVKAENYNRLAAQHPDIDFSLYYIETDVDIPFANGKITHDLPNYLKSKLQSISFDSLYIDSLEKYQQYFFKTDHHWSIGGQHQGYRDIIRLLKGPQEPLLQVEGLLLPEASFAGHKARTGRIQDIEDPFGMLKANLPPYDTYVNGTLRTYNSKRAYEKGEFTREEGANHYALCYGHDYGLIQYHFPHAQKEGNLLVFCCSFSNPINELIASHYQNTYFIDLRHYERDMGKAFSFSEFIEDKNIENVLFMGYAAFYSGDAYLVND